MRPVSVFANASAAECERLCQALRSRWRPAVRAMMVLLSLHGLSPAQVAALVEYDPGTVPRRIGGFNAAGVTGLQDRPRCGRPRLGGGKVPRRIAALLKRPGPWTVRRIFHHLGRPRLSRRTLYRRVRQVAIWRRPKLVACGDPAHAAVVAAIVRRLRLLPAGSVIWAADETHLHLLPHGRSSWTLPTGARTSPPRAPTGN